MVRRSELPAGRFRSLLLVMAGVLLLMGTTFPAAASHFRGGALVPSVDANGVLTVIATTFWRPMAVSCTLPRVFGLGRMVQVVFALDTSDSRFTACQQIYTVQLPGPGTFPIEASSCCRVAGIINAFENSWTLNSTIVWDGVNPTVPIQFNFAAIQIEVGRDQDYIGAVGAIAAPGLTLTYDQALNQNIHSQPPGFTIDPSSGAMFIAQADAATYLDNRTANVGADYAFSGNIFASDGSQVEFDWMFDAVDQGPTIILVPEVEDALEVVEVGDLLDYVATGLDPNPPPVGPLPLTWDFPAFLGTGANLAPSFDPLTQLFLWDTFGSLVGTYAAQFRANNGSKTDIGTLTIHLVDTFDPFGGITVTRSRTLRLRLTRPSPTTSGVRAVETEDPFLPDFTGIPFTPFTNGEVEIHVLLSEGNGTKTVCWQYEESTGLVSEPICEEIELETEVRGEVAISKARVELDDDCREEEDDDDSDSDSDSDSDDDSDSEDGEAEACEDEFRVRGTLLPGEGSDGIDPPNEEVTVDFGSFTETIPVGSFFLRGADGPKPSFRFDGEEPGIEKIHILADTLKFELEAEELDLLGIDLGLPVPFRMQIGDDIFETTIVFDGKGKAKRDH